MAPVEDGLRVRPMTAEDAAALAASERAQGWQDTDAKHESRLRDVAAGRCVTLCALLRGEPVGYVSVYCPGQDGPEALRALPEVVDLNVLERARRRGVGTALLDAAEALASSLAPQVYLGVGLHAGYGSAQRLYARRGYVPDGSGVWYGGEPLAPYAPCINDDDLVLYLTRRLRDGAGAEV